MSAVESFLREIVARPNDPAPRIALAEWLERFGDARDELIRLHHLLTECSDDDEYFRLLQREQVIRWFVADERLEQLGCDDAYARFLRLHQGLWLTDSGSLLCWGSPVEKLAASGGARLEQLRPLGVRVIWKDRLIWRGMRATIYADFLPDDEGRLPAGVEHFTIVRPQNWIAPESGAIARMLHRAAIHARPRSAVRQRRRMASSGWSRCGGALGRLPTADCITACSRTCGGSGVAPESNC